VIVARPLYRSFIEFVPSHTLFLVTNHRPDVAGIDEGIWRRLLFVPFTEAIPASERDPALLQKLETESDAILTWAIDGCLAWQRDGLAPPDIVRSLVSEYRKELDHVSQFIEDRCVAQEGLRIVIAELRGAYESWCQVNGIEPLNPTTFGEQLSMKGYPNGKSNNHRVRKGLRLRPRGE
jgi:putative DNA primase/helicase